MRFPAFCLFLLLLQGCNRAHPRFAGIIAMPPSTGITSCTDAQTQEDLLLKQFVDESSQSTCVQDSDCVSADTGSGCGCPSYVNQTAAQGYADYLSSSQYAAIRNEASSLGCGICTGSCGTLGTAACVQGMCVSKQ